MCDFNKSEVWCGPRCATPGPPPLLTIHYFGDCGELFLDDSGLLTHIYGIVTPTLGENQSVLSDSVDTVGFESKFWGPRLAKWSGFMEFGRCRADFHWDPGSSEALLSIWFIILSADSKPAHHHELHVAWPCFIVLMQQKCNEPYEIARELAVLAVGCIVYTDYVLKSFQVPGRAPVWNRFASAQFQSVGNPFSIVEVFACQLEAICVDNLHVSGSQPHSFSEARSQLLVAQDNYVIKGCGYISEEGLVSSLDYVSCLLFVADCSRWYIQGIVCKKREEDVCEHYFCWHLCFELWNFPGTLQICGISIWSSSVMPLGLQYSSAGLLG
jgi:hypothetical protein